MNYRAIMGPRPARTEQPQPDMQRVRFETWIASPASGFDFDPTMDHFTRSRNGIYIDMRWKNAWPVWVAAQANAVAREQQLTDALQAFVKFAAQRMWELGELSPEMTAVVTKVRAALDGK